jgi:ATP-dependent Lhr-like helicase
MLLSGFHPVISEWFLNTFQQPTEVQSLAWKEIQKKKHTLIAAPTGSGKTLAAFFVLIDELIQLGLAGNLAPQTYVVYVSPLKALSNDIERNLQYPLHGIEEALIDKNLPQVNVQVAVRTGDTPSSERTAMVKKPPHILVTTPESLYLLLTSVNGRKMLSNVQTVIVDEIHALVSDKRGTHLALSLERLRQLSRYPLQRIGLSATQKPIEQVASFLTGVQKNEEDNHCSIVDTGHQRKINIRLEVPESPLSAVMSAEVWDEVYSRLVTLIEAHRTTLIFVNTRRLAERLAHHLSERLGQEKAMSHHGSMSKEQRFDAEQRLKEGSLQVLVATASLELGIDIGAVNLVCQLSSPKSIATFLQRVGRSGHFVGGTPKGIIFPFTRDELVECTALIDAVNKGELDRLIIPEKPLDILAQQVVAEVATDEWEVGALYELVTSAYPYRDLSQQEFNEVVKMLADGFTTRRGRRGAYLHHDAINGKVRGRKGARLTALTSGGAIPDTFNYDVVLEPENTYIGNLNEDFAIESMPGDIFQLGNHSWRILRVEEGKVRVQDAKGLPPSLPFWLGEGPGRTKELSEAVSRLREHLGKLLHQDPLVTQTVEKADVDKKEDQVGYVLKDPEKNQAIQWLMREVGLPLPAAEQLTVYLSSAQNALGAMPTRSTIVMERFFDEVGDMHLVVHSPYGSRLNKAWGLSLRKRFCKQFNFELQAAANEDAVILSLGSTHSFPLDEVYRYLNSKTVREVLTQAMLDSPMFEVRWRWNASRALAILRMRAGKRVPPQIQRMNAEDLVAQVFPDQIACQENISGPREVSDHPLVRQTIHDCLTEAMDIDELEELIGKIENHQLALHAKDLREPSPLAQEILNARPYAFLDDAPLEERRTRAVRNRRWLDPTEALELGKLDQQAIDAVKREAWPIAGGEDELHDALILLGFLTEQEVEEADGINNWAALITTLLNNGRACQAVVGKTKLWIAAERLPLFKALSATQSFVPDLHLPAALQQEEWEEEKALRELIRGRLEGLGPITIEAIAASIDLPIEQINFAVIALEAEGFVFQGRFTAEASAVEWCERRLLARIHRYTVESLRKQIEPLSTADFMRFLFMHHKMTAEEQVMGPYALQDLIDRLQGIEIPAGAWETEVLPMRMQDYDPSWLDVLCMSGRVSWGRFSNPNKKNKNKSPLKSTPISFVDRNNLYGWNYPEATAHLEQLSLPAQRIMSDLQQHGASFYQDLQLRSGMLGTQVESALSELVSHGVVTSDSFTGLRALLTPSYNRPAERSGHRRSRKAVFGIEHAGRWSLIPKEQEEKEYQLKQERLERMAFLLLKRYGVVFRRILDKERFAMPWRDLVRVYRRLEARGEVRGGRFVVGVSGEQYALPETVDRLKQLRKTPKSGQLISISAVDPINFTGNLFPGVKVSSLIKNRVLYKDGVPVAILESGDTHFLIDLTVEERWEYQKALLRSVYPAKLKAYLGKNYS